MFKLEVSPASEPACELIVALPALIVTAPNVSLVPVPAVLLPRKFNVPPAKVIGTESPMRLALLVPVLSSVNVPPGLIVRPLRPTSVPLPLRVSVPWFTVVVLTLVSGLDRMRLPGPALTKDPRPVMTPVKVKLLVVLVALRVRTAAVPASSSTGFAIVYAARPSSWTKPPATTSGAVGAPRALLFPMINAPDALVAPPAAGALAARMMPPSRLLLLPKSLTVLPVPGAKVRAPEPEMGPEIMRSWLTAPTRPELPVL